ncbi:hypothetical protein [Streptomyces werraensis]|uniref:hypothetical protein n=1 Tax=Streptomyces werraensis TaxID=68284 RepID=UPI001CE3AE58
MSTPAPDSTPFDPHAFPADLVATQRQAAELRRPPRPPTRPPSPDPARHTTAGPKNRSGARKHPGRPASPGWAEAKAAEFDRLLPELRTTTAQVQCHLWWKRCAGEGIKGEAMVAARQALRYAEGAVPLGRGDAETTT